LIVKMDDCRMGMCGSILQKLLLSSLSVFCENHTAEKFGTHLQACGTTYGFSISAVTPREPKDLPSIAITPIPKTTHNTMSVLHAAQRELLPSAQTSKGIRPVCRRSPSATGSLSSVGTPQSHGLGSHPSSLVLVSLLQN
jgi:hypothetical protein